MPPEPSYVLPLILGVIGGALMMFGCALLLAGGLQ